MSSRIGIFVLTTIVFAGTAYAGTPPVPRPCRGDIYFVDIPIWANPPWTSATHFAALLDAHLTQQAQVSWFCGTDGPSCTNPTGYLPISVLVTTVLPQRTVAGETWRNDGHRRFLRVTFSSRSNQTGAPLVARPSQTCQVVAQIRASALAVSPGAPIFVGRDCEATGNGQPIEAAPSPEMLDWHKERLGYTPSALSSQNVDLVLIDSGIDPAAAPLLNVATTAAFGTLTNKYHPHGSGMASLMREIEPDAPLHDLRVLDFDGHSLSAPIASALDHALFTIKSPTRPMIINMSLGWPRFDSEYAQLVSGNCATWEDPAGEIVRYLVTGAAVNDRATVIAAAGNDPSAGAGFEGSSSAPLNQPIPPACALLNQRAPWFYPALWDLQRSCFPSGVERASVIGVTGTDDREVASAVGIPNYESPLVAPSDHVYAQIPGVPANSARNCPASLGVRGVESPQVFSGTSVSAALVSAAAARAQKLWLSTHSTPLTTVELEKMLYLTGESLCRTTDSPFIPIRRLHIGRLEEAFSHIDCVDNLRTCSPSSSEINVNTVTNCSTVLSWCGLNAVCPLDSPPPPTWSTFDPPCDGDLTDTFTLGTCTNGACPFNATPNSTLVGSTGPQPETPGCPECLLQCAMSGWTLFAQLTSNFPTGTTITDPTLVLDNGTIQYIQLSPPTPANVWLPGASVNVAFDPSVIAPVGSCKTVKATLVMTIVQGGKSSKDYSALRVEAAN